MPKNVLITGITGFIGSHMAKRLLEKGYNVYGVVKYVVGRDKERLKEDLKDVTLFTCDITDYNTVLNTLKTISPDYVVHLASMSPVRLSFEAPFEFQMTNYIGSLNIAHALLKLPDFEERRLIVASTAEVYGIQPENKPFTENMPLKPSSPYSVSKAAMDMYIRMMINSFNLNATIMRCVNTYGRKHSTGFIIEYIVTQMLKGNKIYIGAPDSIRDYMYVDDHVNAYITAMESPKGRGQVFNASTGIATQNRDITLKIAEKIGIDKDNITFGSYPPGYPYRPLASDQPYLVLNSTKIRTMLGWKTTVPLDEGLDRTIKHWSNKITKS